MACGRSMISSSPCAGYMAKILIDIHFMSSMSSMPSISILCHILCLWHPTTSLTDSCVVLGGVLPLFTPLSHRKNNKRAIEAWLGGTFPSSLLLLFPFFPATVRTGRARSPLLAQARQSLLSWREGARNTAMTSTGQLLLSIAQLARGVWRPHAARASRERARRSHHRWRHSIYSSTAN